MRLSLAPLLSQSSRSCLKQWRRKDRQAATSAQQWRLDLHYVYLVITGIEKSAYAFLEGIAHGAQLEEAIRAGRWIIPPSFDSAVTLDFLFAEGLIVGVQMNCCIAPADAAGGASIKRSSSVEPFCART